MKATENYLLKMLSNNDVTFFIPPYQRNYEWDIYQCEVFLDDIKKVTIDNIKEKYSEHFFGTIVYVQNEEIFGQPSKLVLTDGQQRITTTMLFLIALRDVIDDISSQKFIDNRYLKNENVPQDAEYKIKLKQVETDWEAYKNIVLGLTLTDAQKNSTVYRNYIYFKDQLTSIQQQHEFELLDLISKGLDKFSIVTIQLEPIKNKWENPQEVFESMNSLGKPLALSDLVRNYLLLDKEIEEQERLYHNYWLSIEKELPENISNFIRDYMQYISASSYKKATVSNYKELYSDFKILFKHRKSENLLIDLYDLSKLYAYIALGNPSGNILIDKKISDLRSIGATTIYSFLLGVFHDWEKKKFTDSEVIEILDILITYFLRRRILKLTQGENKSLPTLGNNLTELSMSTNKSEYMFKILASKEYSLRIPNDIEVENELKEMNFYNFKQNKFMLALVEETLTKSKPNPKDNLLQIEHIMPQTLNSSWKTELGEDYENTHQKYINNIGNLTLIRHNQELGNNSFEYKKEVYENNSGLQIAKKEIINRSKWNKNSILNRSRWLSQFIVSEVIPIPSEMRKINNFNTKSRSRSRSRSMSFKELGLIGEYINFISDTSIIAKVVGDREVEFEGKEWKLSPLTREIETRKGTVTKSGSYQGAQYWEYEGMKIDDLF